MPRINAPRERKRSSRREVSSVRGVSLFEIIVVVAVFSMIAVLMTRSTFLTLRGSKKSDSQIRVKENLEYSLSVIERQLRNADLVTSSCDGSAQSRIDYVDIKGATSFFACQSVGPSSGYIASGSARLTTDKITITACSFVCSAQDGTVPPSVTVSLTGKDLGSTGVETSNVSISTKIFLRTY